MVDCVKCVQHGRGSMHKYNIPIVQDWEESGTDQFPHSLESKTEFISKMKTKLYSQLSH